MSVEPGVVEHRFGIGIAVGIEEGLDGAVAFAVEWGKEIDEQGEYYASEEELGIEIVDA